jgi:two-component system, NarL family, sensor kinase
LNPELTPILVITLFLVIVAIGIVMLVLLYQQKQMQNIKEKEQLKALFEKEILESKLEIQEQTFKNISQEIHDNIGQQLIFAKLTMNTIDLNGQTEIKEKIDSTNHLITRALQDLRNLSKSLNADNIADLGLVKAIENEIEIIKRTGKYVMIFNKEDTASNLSSQQELILFRIFQETLNNIVKHSSASEIFVEIKNSDEGFVLQVKDNGNGFDTSEMEEKGTGKKGLGIRNMKNRTQLIGGDFTLTTGKGIGTSIKISLPYK